MLPKQKCNKSIKLKFIDALLVKFYPILLGHKSDQIWNGFYPILLGHNSDRIWNGHTTFLVINW